MALRWFELIIAVNVWRVLAGVRTAGSHPLAGDLTITMPDGGSDLPNAGVERQFPMS